MSAASGPTRAALDGRGCSGTTCGVGNSAPAILLGDSDGDVMMLGLGGKALGSILGSGVSTFSFGFDVAIFGGELLPFVGASSCWF